MNHTGVSHGGNWQEIQQRYGWAPEEILDFSVNINPWGPPPGVWACLADNLKAVRRYPDPNNMQLKEALSSYLQVPREALLIGNGASEIIYLLCFLLRPKAVLLAEPTFAEYSRAAGAAGSKLVTLRLQPSDGFRLEVGAYCRQLSQVDMAFLCHPNNPVGNLLDEEDLQRIWEESERRGTWLVVDESFLDFVPEWPKISLCRVAARASRLIVLRSLTKFFALPGLRLGCAVAAPDLIRYLEARRDPWSVNILAQMAGVEALKDQDYQLRTRTWLEKERGRFYRELASLPGIRPYPSQTNFFLVDISFSGWASSQLAEACARRRVIIRDCSSFPGLQQDYVRVAVKQEEANNCLLRVLRELLEGGRS
ncbi:MAG: threonine-phosphate decarboxylase CobD [Moorellaceae bacterium]